MWPKMTLVGLLLALSLTSTLGSEVDPEVTSVTPRRERVWSEVTLSCGEVDEKMTLLWTTPNNQIFIYRKSNISACLPTSELSSCFVSTGVSISKIAKVFLLNPDEHVRINPENGSIVVKDFGWADRGTYRCIRFQDSQEVDVNATVAPTEVIPTDVVLEYDYRTEIYYFSLAFGFTTAGAFLLLALLFKLVYYVLETYGCCLCCCCCKDQLPPKAKKIKTAMDAIEIYKQQQLDKLKDNYNQQSDWIRQNCASQMERVRENYNGQVQNVKDIRSYGSNQIHAVREQYYEQMHRIRDYSTSQLDRVHENYIFQRQRLRKFSAQNYLRVRATGKYTQRTLNKVMENLPPLYLDLSNCRQGMGGRQESFNFPPDFGIEEIEPFDEHPDFNDVANPRGNFLRDVSEENEVSLYYTPQESGTPMRESAKCKSQSLKGTPVKEAYKAAYGQTKHKKSKSFSHFLPQKWFGSADNNAAPNPSEQRVQVIIENVTHSNDYIDVTDKPDPLASGLPVANSEPEPETIPQPNSIPQPNTILQPNSIPQPNSTSPVEGSNNSAFKNDHHGNAEEKDNNKSTTTNAEVGPNMV